MAQEKTTKLNTNTTYGSQGEKVPMSWQLPCHRAATEDSSCRASDGVLLEGSAASDNEGDLPGDAKPRRSKKVGCTFILNAELVVNSEGGVDVSFIEHNGHFFHTPGDAEDLHWISTSCCQAKNNFSSAVLSFGGQTHSDVCLYQILDGYGLLHEPK